MFNKILIVCAVLLFVLSVPTASYALSTYLTIQGGTGTTSPSGILWGDNGSTNHLNTVTIGSNLTFSGGTLSASGGGGSGTVSTSSSETATYIPVWTSTNGTPALLSGGTSALTFNSGVFTVSGRIETGQIIFTEFSSVSTPSAGTGTYYSKDDGHPYYKNSSGVDFDLTNTTGAFEIATTSSIGIPQLSYFTKTGGRTTLGGVATTSVTCSGNTTCTAFTAIGSAPITISSTGGGTGLATTSPTANDGYLVYNSAGAGSTYTAATTSLSITGPFVISNPIGVLKNGAVTYTGLATTSQPASSNLLTSNGGSGVYGTATSSATCTGSVSCSTFTVVGSVAPTITSSALTTVDISANTNLTATPPIRLIGDNLDFTGLATTTALSSSNLLVSNGLSGVYGVATSSVTCTTGASCTTFNVIGTGSTITTTLGTSVDLASAEVTGVLPIANGGTNANAISAIFTPLVFDGTRIVATSTNPFYIGSLSATTTATSTFTGSVIIGNSGLNPIALGGYIHPYFRIGTTTCPINPTFYNYFEICGNEDSTNGVQAYIGNMSVGTKAFTGWSMGNDKSDTNLTNFAGTYLNSSNYSDVTFGTGVNSPSQLILQNTMSNVSIVASSSTAPTTTFINFLTGGSASGNERMRITSTGQISFGTAAPTGTDFLTVASTSIGAFRVKDAFGTTAFNVNTASTTGPLFSIFATTSSATTCGGAGTTCLFSVDQYGHVAASSTVPVLSSCGTSPSLSSDSSDAWGTIQVGSVAATGCTMTFGSAHTTGTHCTISNENMSVVNAMTYTESLTGFVVSQTGLTSAKLDYACYGQ